MHASAIKYGVLTLTLSLITVIVAFMPFHAFLTVWLSTGIDHYTVLRLWKEGLMLVAGVGVLYLMLFDRKVRFHTLSRKLTWIIIAYLLVQVVWAAVALRYTQLEPKAAAYGLLLNCRFLVFFLLCWAIAVRTDRLERRWPKLLLWPAVIVVVFGLLQVFALPPDFLRHFGYGPDTIQPVATINSNANYQRYASTLRGANPLGAYLLLPISALVVLLVRYPRSWNWTKVLLLIGSIAMLLFSFSRSAWIGAVVTALTALVTASPRAFWQRYRVPLAASLVAAAALLVGFVFALRQDAGFQNLIFHTEDNSKVAVSSNDARASAITSGFGDILRDPLGDGPGSAGPASAYNGDTRIAEDYYLQIGQETGVIGLIMFVVIVSGVGYLLWLRRDTPLALTLLAALVGISLINLLSHAWTDDTLAYVWWGLAGLAISRSVDVREGSDEATTD